jgi:drug/metabolite transporter (DMT)-like permease
VRRPTTVELMLLTTVVLWALNVSVTKYILEHGVAPVAYATLRYGLAALIFIGLALVAERTLRVGRRDLARIGLAAVTLSVNQLCFVYALDLTTASTIGLLLGAIPIFAALFGLALGTERATRRFWAAALVSFAGVGLVAAGAGESFSGDIGGIALGLATAATWAAYSVILAPLMRSYSPTRISAIVIPAAWVIIAVSGFAETRDQSWSLGWEIWVMLAFATVGPLVLTNILWFKSIRRIGANRATLAANLEPFLAAMLAVILLSEPFGILQIAGGILIGAGLLIMRRRTPAAQPT